MKLVIWVIIHRRHPGQENYFKQQFNHGCWSLETLHHQTIRIHGRNCLGWIFHCLPWGQHSISFIISVLGIDIKMVIYVIVSLTPFSMVNAFSQLIQHAKIPHSCWISSSRPNVPEFSWSIKNYIDGYTALAWWHYHCQWGVRHSFKSYDITIL